MEYERIHKVQTGIISPSKLRMKLMGPHNHRKKSASNNNSARTSPTKLGDSESVKNSLLDTMNGDEQVSLPSLDVLPTNLSSEVALPRENVEVSRAKLQQCTKGDGGNSSTVYPLRIMEDENIDYDSNASSSSFEFHKGEKSVHRHISRALSRTMPSKWNDAEKWILNKQTVQANVHRKLALQNQTNRLPVASMGRVAPESANCDFKLDGKVADTKRVDFCLPASQPASQIGFDKFCFVPSESHPSSGQACGGNVSFDASSQSKDLKEVESMPCSKVSVEETSTATSAIRSVSMRDMGTEMTPEMTPIPSQEPSRTSTPLGATTPIRSPTSSIPSTPRRGAPAPTPTTDEESYKQNGSSKSELTEEEQKLKTRREIVELGVQLGKMNIAAWASKAEQDRTNTCADTVDMAELERVDFEKRAAAWEEVEKSKHMARYKRAEIQIQAWESQQKAKLEAEMRRIEAQVEQMRAQAESRIMRKIALARQKSEEKRAAAEARKTQNAVKTAAQAEYIRQTGRMPPTHYMCCGWLS
ncbi:uncharacterized protein LOC126787781 [Argentina anserina]|uniref:uncharacterized protein LOC126787781 n=1 Tax=Argentina anserina TaxID=57926 RepID=UPI0021764BDA|nr:uncharacterized protein LOC126787781 [Potentilla anserina]